MTDKSPEQKSAEQKSSRRRIFKTRPLLTLPQIVVLVAVVAALIIGLDLNRRARTGQVIYVGEEALQDQVDLEKTRQVELQLTRDYVFSEDYVQAYARGEAGLILPGERRVVPLVVTATPAPTAAPTPTPDPAYDAHQWQAWWRLFTDAELPSR